MWLIRPANFLEEVRLFPLSAIPKHLTNGTLRPLVPILVFLWPPRVGTAPVVGAFGTSRKPESNRIVSRYQVATPSRTITARATGPKVNADSLMRTSSRTPRRFCGADHRKRLRRPDSNWRHSAYETDGIGLTSPLRDLSSGGWGRTNDLVINSHPLSR